MEQDGCLKQLTHPQHNRHAPQTSPARRDLPRDDVAHVPEPRPRAARRDGGHQRVVRHLDLAWPTPRPPGCFGLEGGEGSWVGRLVELVSWEQLVGWAVGLRRNGVGAAALIESGR